MDQIFVQIRFIFDTEFGQYRDALYYPIEDYYIIDQKQIENEKQIRVNDFIDLIKNPPEPLLLTKEQLLDQLNELESLKIEIENKKIEVQQKIVEIENKEPKQINDIIFEDQGLKDGK